MLNVITEELLTGVSDAECANTEEFSAGRAQLDVVAFVVVDASFGQHSIVLDITLPEQKRIRRGTARNYMSGIPCTFNKRSAVSEAGIKILLKLLGPVLDISFCHNTLLISITFLERTHERHHLAYLWGRDMGCLFELEACMKVLCLWLFWEVQYRIILDQDMSSYSTRPCHPKP